MFRKLKRGMEGIKKTQIKLLVVKTVVCDMKNTLGGINGILDITVEKMSEFDDMGEKTQQKEMTDNGISRQSC